MLFAFKVVLSVYILGHKDTYLLTLHRPAFAAFKAIKKYI